MICHPVSALVCAVSGRQETAFLTMLNQDILSRKRGFNFSTDNFFWLPGAHGAPYG